MQDPSVEPRFIPADDDDFDEDSIPAFSQPMLTPTEMPDKGKIRSERLPSPTVHSSQLSGNIGSSPTPLNNPKRTVGGVRVETRLAIHLYKNCTSIIPEAYWDGSRGSQGLGSLGTVDIVFASGNYAQRKRSSQSFFQGLCVLGYCVAPLDIAALVACFVRKLWIRAPIALLAWAWCCWASVNFLDGTKIEQQRILLAVYPLLMFYFILAWMILIE
ncbi:hypothetical protein Clacol_002853 [Clathrus columnatus]|uniref:Protein YIP n=1 Tax=Clathrus columnatus TaxID=1419009 RepID=A0AAV5A7B2_9AGAM|nr:hypothetical protein Clacol_002853 [Clathrus columnatus]